MILDDDPETLELLTRVLNKHYEVITEMDPARLLEENISYKPDLILVDHFIGDVTSRDVINAFRQKEPFKQVPVIIHSAHEQIEHIANSINAAGFIRKPSGIKEIRDYIHAHLNGNTAASTGV